jgi:endonuclease-3
MSAKNRADLIAKLFKFVKKEFQAVSPPSNRSVIEHLLYGCCLEDSTFEAADEAFAKLQENYFDWNEVRVTTANELAESMKSLSDPQASATRLKKTLHGVFETYYQFDIDFLKKENLSKAVIQFEKFKGITPFIVSHVAQNGLGGHSIPLDKSAMLLFYTLGIVTEEESAKMRVSGLERTIPKAKGIEFSVLLHQFAVAFSSSPFSTKIRDQILKISKDAKDRFPKRGGRKKVEPAKPAKEKPVAEKSAPAKPVKAKAAKQKVVKVAKKSKAKPAKATKAIKKTAVKKTAVKKTAAKKKTAKKPVVSAKTTKKVTKKTTKKKKLPAKKTSAKKGAASKRLGKKKPR